MYGESRGRVKTNISFSSPDGSFTAIGRCSCFCAAAGAASLGAGEVWNGASARERRRAWCGRGLRRRRAVAEWRRRAAEGVGGMIREYARAEVGGVGSGVRGVPEQD